MPTPLVYSFLDTVAAIVGSGGAFNIGAGAGVAEEGISVIQSGEMNNMKIGADGSGMHSLSADKSGKVTVRLLKNSPTNSLLMTMAQLQRTSASLHGQNQITISNKTSGDVISCQQCAFSKIPDINYAKEGDMLEWEFDSVIIDPALGAGVTQ
jgi:hypothetical protein